MPVPTEMEMETKHQRKDFERKSYEATTYSRERCGVFFLQNRGGRGLFCPRVETEKPLKTEPSATQPHWVEKIFMTLLSDLPASINIISISRV